MKNLKTANSSDIYAKIAVLDSQWHNELHYHTVDGTLPTKDNVRGLKLVVASLALTGLLVLFANPNESLLVGCLGFLLFVFGTVAFFKKDNSYSNFKEAKDAYENARRKLLGMVQK